MGLADDARTDAIDRAFAEARAAWPGVGLDRARFAAWIEERAAGGVPLDGISAKDVYLACACAAGEPRALAILERDVLAPLHGHLARAHGAQVADEVLQGLRVRLLVGEDGKSPKLASYKGSGPLGGWLRMIGTRMAIDVQRASAGAPEEQEEEIRSPAADPELQLLRATYEPEFRRAFHATVAKLEARDASVLRLHYVDGMPVEAIAKMYRVSARTVQRWLADVRAMIVDATRKELKERLGVNSREVDSIVGAIESQLDVSVSQYLGR